MRYNKGDIVIIPVPFTDNEHIKLRPAVVISNDIVHKTGDVLIVQITSKLKNDSLSMVLTEDDVTQPLPVVSYIRFHKIFILDHKLIKAKVSVLHKNKYTELVNAIFLLIK